MTDTPAFSDNTVRSRFELTEQGLTAFASYQRGGDVLAISYVEAPAALRGTGTAGRLMTEIVHYARTNHMKVRPTCSYAVSWFRRNSSSNDVLE
jgi:predicted GNAT family acetyltransferase